MTVAIRPRSQSDYKQPIKKLLKKKTKIRDWAFSLYVIFVPFEFIYYCLSRKWYSYNWVFFFRYS